MATLSRRIIRNIREKRDGSRRPKARRARQYDGGRRPIERKRPMAWIFRRYFDEETKERIRKARAEEAQREAA